MERCHSSGQKAKKFECPYEKRKTGLRYQIHVTHKHIVMKIDTRIHNYCIHKDKSVMEKGLGKLSINSGVGSQAVEKYIILYDKYMV